VATPNLDVLPAVPLVGSDQLPLPFADEIVHDVGMHHEVPPGV
jgi:hypothetical protein